MTNGTSEEVVSEPPPSAKRAPSRVELLLEFVKDGIVTGRFQPGDKLPTENDIAEELCISRTPVREGFKILEALGMVDIKVGAGTFVRDNLEASVAQLMLFKLYLRTTSSEKLVEVRRIIELGCAELAAKRRTPEDLRNMEDAINRLAAMAQRGDATVDEMTEADLDFHRAMFKATHNELIITIANFVLDMVSPWIRQSVAKVGPEPAVLWHRIWYAMIEAKEQDMARTSFESRQVDLGMDFFRSTIKD